MTSEESRTRPQPGTGWLLAPLTGIGGFVYFMFERSAFFDDGSYWNNLSLGGQAIFTLKVIVAAVVATAVITAFFPSWRRNFWGPIIGAIPVAYRWLLSWRLVRSQDAVENAPGATRAATPNARIASTVRRLGSFNVSRQLDGTRAVSWAQNGLQIGILRPASGDRWEVIYGRRDRTGARAQFIEIENLGYVNTEPEAATMLGERDKEEASESPG